MMMMRTRRRVFFNCKYIVVGVTVIHVPLHDPHLYSPANINGISSSKGIASIKTIKGLRHVQLQGSQLFS